MKTMVLATNNLGKLREFQSLLPEWKLVSLKDIGYTKEIIEDGKTFEENALIKAKTIAIETNCTVIADDSGLEVEALGGAPGIFSARYANGHDDEENNALLLKNLKGVENRRARYVCALCVYHPDGSYHILRDTCEGEIIDERRGENGFGYDPYFYIPNLGHTFAEISLEEKNKISHRAKALRRMKELYHETFSS